MAERVFSNKSHQRSFHRSSSSEELTSERNMSKKCILKSFKDLTVTDPSLSDDTRRAMLTTEKDVEKNLECSSSDKVEEDDAGIVQVGNKLKELSNDLDRVARRHKAVLDKMASQLSHSVDPMNTLKQYLEYIFNGGLSCGKIILVIIICYLLIKEYVCQKFGDNLPEESLAEFIIYIVETVAGEFVRNRVIPFIREQCHTCTEWIRSHWEIFATVGGALAVSVGILGYLLLRRS